MAFAMMLVLIYSYDNVIIRYLPCCDWYPCSLLKQPAINVLLSVIKQKDSGIYEYNLHCIIDWNWIWLC